MIAIRKRPAAALLLLFSAACGPVAINVSDAWTRPTAEGGIAAIYFLLENATDQDDVLLSAATEAARVVEIHHSMAVDADEMDGMIDHSLGSNENSADEGEPALDVMIMAPLTGLELGSGEEILFEPGSYHLMLVDLKQDLQVGDSFVVTLDFERADNLDVLVRVLAP